MNFNKISPNSRTKEIKNSFVNLIKESTIQGLPNVFRRKRMCLKIMWLIAFLISSLACGYYIIECVIDFYSYEYTTSIKTILEIPSEFPAVSFCPFPYATKLNFKILRLSFNSYEYSNGLNMFHFYNDTLYGQCFRINFGKDYFGKSIEIMKSFDSGIYYGLKLELYFNNSYDFNEYLIHIHNKSVISDSMSNRGYLITTGSYNYFLIKRNLEEKLPYPYNDCYKDVSLFPLNKTLINYITKVKNNTYTRNECINLCRSLKYIENRPLNCGCILESFNQGLINSKCFKINCVKEFLFNFQEKNPYIICSDYCPNECDSSNIDVIHSIEPIPFMENVTNSAYSVYSDFKTYSNLSRNYLAIYIYYTDLKYTHITQKPKMEMFDLVSNIGGLFGLFLGMGLMSFLEIFEIIFEALFILNYK